MSVKSLVSVFCPPFLKPVFNHIKRSPIGYRLAKGMFWSMAVAACYERSLELMHAKIPNAIYND
jgi:hypothetical protein